MLAYDLDSRRLLAREHAERLRHDARAFPRLRRRRQLLESELPLQSARRRAAALRAS